MKFLNNITGKTIEEKVSEYSDIYGEILLGMHQEIESQRKRIHDYSLNMQQIIDKEKIKLDKWSKETQESLEDSLVQLQNAKREAEQFYSAIMALKEFVNKWDLFVVEIKRRTTMNFMISIFAIIFTLIILGMMLWKIV